MISDALRRSAEAWIAQDPDPETRSELIALLKRASDGDQGSQAILADSFDGRLEFGTAGLRAELGAGPNRMNRVLVAQAAAGFAAFLLARENTPSVVIGYDSRKNSDVFARDTAEIMEAAGVRAILLSHALPTPVLAFAVRHLGVSAGVMVTASHNPPNDNGYKVYLGGSDGGSQIVSPVDAEIAALIDTAAQRSVLDIPRSSSYSTADDDLVVDYVRLTAAVTGGPVAKAYEPRVVYTAMHGVGWEVARRVFATAGFTEPIPVAEQVAPDARFPTVTFPNPEEPGSMDLAFATGTRVAADLIIANDPDADRLAVAIPTHDGSSWRRLSGNEVGALLGLRAAERLRAEGSTGTLAASIVSSPALAIVARHFDLKYVDTLTGFKWVSRVDDLVYGYEEALGYLVDPAKVRDKDGISAAVDVLALVTELRAAGRDLESHLRDFDARFGAFASSQVSLRVTDLADIPRITEALRSAPPSRIGSHEVARLDDFAAGLEGFPPGDILRFWLHGKDSHDGSRVIVRPSGTEPKLKVYIDAWSMTGSADTRRAAANAVVAELECAVRELLR